MHRGTPCRARRVNHDGLDQVGRRGAGRPVCRATTFSTPPTQNGQICWRGRQLPPSVGDGAASASAIACSVALTARLARRIHSLRSSSVRSGQGFTSPVVSIACPACSLRAIPFIALRLRVALASFIRDSLRSRHRPCFPAARNWQQTTTRPATQTGLDMLNPRTSSASPASRLVNPFLEGNASTTQRFPVITGEHERRRPPVSRQLPALSHRQRLSCCEGSRASRFIGVALWRIGWSGRASARRARLSPEDATEWPAPSPGGLSAPHSRANSTLEPSQTHRAPISSAAKTRTAPASRS